VSQLKGWRPYSSLNFSSRFFWKTFFTFSSLLLLTTTIISWLVINQLEAYMMDDFVESLQDKAILLEPTARQLLLSDKPSESPLAAVVNDLAILVNSRITLINNHGEVLFDTNTSTNTPHALYLDRPEIQQALDAPYGVAKRYSSSVNEQMLYLARPVTNQGKPIGFVRVSIALEQIKAQTGSIRNYISAISFASIFIALIACFIISRRVTGPLTEMVSVAQEIRLGNYEAKVNTIPKDEVGKLGKALNMLGNDLQRLDQMRRDFVANVSHEIKTPLTSIKGYVETLANGAIVDPNYNQKFLEKINRNVERLEFLVQDLLSLARIEAEEGKVKLVPVYWHPIIESVVARHEDIIINKNISLTIPQEPTQRPVMGDKEAMTQILENLLSNAIKYTSQDGNITIKFNQYATHLDLTVTDTGIGIPEVDLSRVFERFYRVDKARSREMGGTGLGLSIVKHLVQSMNGGVSVESKLGVGSKFIVQLKLA